MRLSHAVLAAWAMACCLLLQPVELRARSFRSATMTAQAQGRSHRSVTVSSPSWWRERKTRFHQLALCGLASANVTYTLLVGFSGFGAVIPFTAALLGVVMCL